MVIIAVPFINMVLTAISDEREVYLNPGRLFWIPDPVRLDNFGRALTFPLTNFFRATANTMIIIVIDVTATVIVSSWVAYGFGAVRFKGRKLLFLFMLSTMMIPYQIRLIPLYIFLTRLGWVNTFMPLVIFSFFGAPFYIFLIRQFIKGIPGELFDAGKIDGCNNFRSFFWIALPQLTPVVSAVAVFTFINQWKELMGPLIYLRRPELFTVAMELNKLQSMLSITHLADVPLTNLLMAASILTMVPPTIIFILGQKYFLKGLDISSGLKG
jgi:multiple sugar transport system permease protein